MAIGVTFDGRRRVMPGAVSRIVARGTVGKGSNARVVAVLGQSLGGAPLTLLEYRDPVEAREALRGGSLLDAMRMAWDPSPDHQGADRIYAVRCASTAAKGVLVLEDGSATDVVDLSSRDYGAWANNLRVRVEAGTNVATYPGVKKVTVENQLLPGIYEIGDDLGKALSIRYTGSGSACALTITVTAGVAVTLATTCTGAASDDLSLSLALPQFDTVAKLVEYIDSHANYEANLVGAAGLASSKLDPASAVAIKVEAAVHFPAILNGVIDWFNANSQYLAAARHATANTGAPANLAWTNLASGSDGTEDAAAYTAALALLAARPEVAYIVVASGSASFQAQALEHCSTVERENGWRRRVFCGSALSDSLATAKTNAALVRSFRSSYYYPGIKRVDENDTLTTYGGWAVAAMAAGMSVGLHRESTLTNKSVRAGGVEVELTRAQIEELLDAGVCPVQLVSGRGIRLVRAVTTDVGNSNNFYHDQSNVDLSDSMVTEIEGVLEDQYVGQYGSVHTLEAIRQAVDTYLRQYASQGILFGDEDNPPYRNIVVTLDGDTVSVAWEARLAPGINYILQTGHFTLGATAAIG